jgi:hypothetical protein
VAVVTRRGWAWLLVAVALVVAALLVGDVRAAVTIGLLAGLAVAAAGDDRRGEQHARALARAEERGARRALRAEADWLSANLRGVRYDPRLREGFRLAAGLVDEHASRGQSWRQRGTDG